MFLSYMFHSLTFLDAQDVPDGTELARLESLQAKDWIVSRSGRMLRFLSQFSSIFPHMSAVSCRSCQLTRVFLAHRCHWCHYGLLCIAMYHCCVPFFASHRCCPRCTLCGELRLDSDNSTPVAVPHSSATLSATLRSGLPHSTSRTLE